MVEGLLVLFGVTSYVCIAKLIVDHTPYYSTEKYIVILIIYLSFGWVIAPFWLVYKFWEWLLLGFPTYLRSRKK